MNYYRYCGAISPQLIGRVFAGLPNGGEGRCPILLYGTRREFNGRGSGLDNHTAHRRQSLRDADLPETVWAYGVYIDSVEPATYDDWSRQEWVQEPERQLSPHPRGLIP